MEAMLENAWNNCMTGLMHMCMFYKQNYTQNKKNGQSWSKLVTLGHRAKLVTNGQVTYYKLYVPLVTWKLVKWVSATKVSDPVWLRVTKP